MLKAVRLSELFRSEREGAQGLSLGFHQQEVWERGRPRQRAESREGTAAEESVRERESTPTSKVPKAEGDVIQVI